MFTQKDRQICHKCALISRLLAKKIIIGKNNKGFSLSEVLLAIAIIGVALGIGMGIIVPKIEEMQFKSALKSNTTTLYSATNKIMSENGGTLMDVFAGDNDMRDKYLAHLSHTKKCNTGQSFDNCFHNGTNGSMKYLNGSPVTNWGNNAGAILNNGALLRIWSNITCSNIQDNITRCGVIFIDVNGWKAPNTVGKDIYYFHVTKTGLKPYGAQGDGHANTCVSTSNGFGCAAHYLMGN